jgi:peptidoglycan/LPS O-acetylase OafA/YrhL
MVFGLARPDVSRFLLSPALRFVGRIAYSYYLLHIIWTELMARLLTSVVPGLVIAIVGIAGSLVLAWLIYRWVEVPSIRLGQALYRRIRNRMARRALVTVPRLEQRRETSQVIELPVAVRVA